MAKMQTVTFDYEALAVGVEHMRESLRAMVTGLMTDGFTEKQAREITVAIMIRKVDDDDDDAV